MRKTRVLTFPAAILGIVLALGLTGCGEDGDDGVATLDEDTSSADDAADEDGGGEDGDDADIEEQAKKFEECMDDNGIDMAEHGMIAGRTGPGGAQTEERSSEEGQPEELSPAEQEQFEAALEECEKYMPTPELSPAEEAEMREKALAYTECMREKGFDMPDPEVEGGGMALSLDEDAEFDPEDPAFQDADKECLEKHMGAPGEPKVQGEQQ